jgi:hypothetical protein
VAQPQSRENNTCDHLGESSSELKLTAFPEKSIQPIPVPRLACSRVWLLLTNQLLVGSRQRIHLLKQAPPGEEFGIKFPELNSPKPGW